MSRLTEPFMLGDVDSQLLINAVIFDRCDAVVFITCKTKQSHYRITYKTPPRKPLVTCEVHDDSGDDDNNNKWSK